MQPNGVRSSPESQTLPGVVELREDVPLKSGAGFGHESAKCCGGGPRFIVVCFVALSIGITFALLTQIYYGYQELVPHGSVSSSSAVCSQAGTELLKDGGKAIDAVAAAALCLAIVAPHRTSLDASGSLLYWEYRKLHVLAPTLSEWGGPEFNQSNGTRPPKLISALVSLHSKMGVLPWSRILQPAINLAKNGFTVSIGLSQASADAVTDEDMVSGTTKTAVQLATYLEKLQQNTSAELSAAWNSDSNVETTSALGTDAGRWRVYAGGAGAAVAGEAIGVAMTPPPPDYDTAFQKVVGSLQHSSLGGKWPPTGVASGLAVIDKDDTYVAMVTGLSKPFGSGPVSPDGWPLDIPASALDLAPAIIVDEQVCGLRYVIGAESSSALAQGAVALLTVGLEMRAIEKARVSVYAGGVLAIEATRKPPTALLPKTLVNATLPYPSVNVVQQKGNELQSDADSRGGGVASRF